MMDGFQEKKWFVYLVDHHEGPFSLAEIEEKLAQGQVTPVNYVWTEGMADWNLMKELSAFETLIKDSAARGGASASATSDGPSITDGMLASSSMPAEAAQSGRSASLPSATQVDVPPAADEPSVKIDTSSPALHQKKDAAPPKGAPAKKRKISFAGASLALFFILLLAGTYAIRFGVFDQYFKSPEFQSAVRPTLLQLSAKFPALGKWISPIPKLEDVTPEDYETLRLAASSPLQGGSPSLAFARAQGSDNMPVFYVASNLPDGAKFEIYLDGIPETLIGRLDANSRSSIAVDKNLGKSQPLVTQDGKALPTGEYVVSVTESLDQPAAIQPLLANLPALNAGDTRGLPNGLKLIVRKNVFLGGAKDASYSAQLKEYHDRVREKAAQELKDLAQIEGEFEKHLSLLTSKFGDPHKARTGLAAKKKVWGAFNEKEWPEIETQINSRLQAWSTPEAIKSQYYYDGAYSMAQQAGAMILRLHSLQSDFLSATGNVSSAEIQLGEATSAAQGALLSLKTRIAQLEKLPPSAAGLPQKE